MDEMMKRLGFSMQGEEENTERTARGKLKFHDIAREFRDNIQGLMQDFVAFFSRRKKGIGRPYENVGRSAWDL